jgi:murein DD-endopeptidase MepM/ murein hydrolase activator NlpD
LVASQPVRRASHRALTADIEPDERRSWFSYGLAALGISALGLAAAGSISLTTSAQTTETAGQTTTVNTVTSPAPTTPTPAASTRSSRQAAVLETFSRRPNVAADDDRTPALRAAIAREQSAQRAEKLAKGADDIVRSTQQASSDARQDQLRAANRASGLAAAKLAEEKLRRAVAARVAASLAREARERSERAEASNPGRSATPAARTADSTGNADHISTGGRAVSPVPGAVIGTRFGVYGIWSRYHTGLDFRAAYGTPIRAVKSGLVLFAGNTGDWAGNHVAIRHADGRTTMYSHMSSMAVGSGQTVQAGQVIGYVGQTGRAFGAHLHFELYPAGVRYGDVYKAIDPQPWLAANGVNTR